MILHRTNSSIYERFSAEFKKKTDLDTSHGRRSTCTGEIMYFLEAELVKKSLSVGSVNVSVEYLMKRVKF